MYGIAEIITMNTPAMIELIERSGGVRVHYKASDLQKLVDKTRAQAMVSAGLLDENGERIDSSKINRRW